MKESNAARRKAIDMRTQSVDDNFEAFRCLQAFALKTKQATTRGKDTTFSSVAPVVCFVMKPFVRY